MDILPGVLAYTETDFRQRLLHPDLRKLAPLFHVDVLDGSMFEARCWAVPSVVGSWGHLPDIELHCMVQDPVTVARAWQTYVPSLKRVIVHYEIGRALQNAVTAIHALSLEVGVAVNPTTPVDVIARLPIDALMVMGVEPGRSGQAFLGEPILAKLRRARALFPQLTLACDGGLSEATVGAIQATGARRGVASSALWKAENPNQAYTALLHKMA